MENEVMFAGSSNGIVNEVYSELRGRRVYCRAKGLKGKSFRACLKGLRQEDKGLSTAEKRELAQARKDAAQAEIDPDGGDIFTKSGSRTSTRPLDEVLALEQLADEWGDNGEPVRTGVNPFLIGGIAIVAIVGGVIAYRKFKNNN